MNLCVKNQMFLYQNEFGPWKLSFSIKWIRGVENEIFLDPNEFWASEIKFLDQNESGA